ncbi:unnamed protein product, partial [Prorocentrum cordatum]
AVLDKDDVVPDDGVLSASELVDLVDIILAPAVYLKAAEIALRSCAGSLAGTRVEDAVVGRVERCCDIASVLKSMGAPTVASLVKLATDCAQSAKASSITAGAQSPIECEGALSREMLDELSDLARACAGLAADADAAIDAQS